MSDYPVPKYSIGDTVYRSDATRESVRIECPDCCGDRVWKATLGTGEEISLACPTCREGFDGASGTIFTYEDKGDVRMLTIGSIQINTHDDNPVRYMCVETGIGSGSVHPETYLYPTRAAAEEALPGKVKAFTESMAANEASRMKHKRGEAGRMEAYCRKKIRDAKKEIEQAERWLTPEEASDE